LTDAWHSPKISKYGISKADFWALASTFAAEEAIKRGRNAGVSRYRLHLLFVPQRISFNEICKDDK